MRLDARSGILPGLPEQVRIYEVGPRDGLQNESATVPTWAKARLIERLADAGLTVIEATSFVHPRWVPQLADAEELLDLLPAALRAQVELPVLVPNERGLQRAAARGVRRIAVFASATEAFAARNLNRSYAEQFAMFAPVFAQARAQGISVRAYVSMCWGDPWEGSVEPARVVQTGMRLLELGADQVSLGDTIGVATPGNVVAVIDAFRAAGVPTEALAVHFHDTYGQALANTLAALTTGITTVDASVGGLGGCPYARSATGNLATEDLVWMLDGLGIQTGVDLDALVATSVWLEGILGRPSPSRVVRARAGLLAQGEHVELMAADPPINGTSERTHDTRHGDHDDHDTEEVDRA